MCQLFFGLTVFELHKEQTSTFTEEIRLFHNDHWLESLVRKVCTLKYIKYLSVIDSDITCHTLKKDVK